MESVVSSRGIEDSFLHLFLSKKYKRSSYFTIYAIEFDSALCF